MNKGKEKMSLLTKWESLMYLFERTDTIDISAIWESDLVAKSQIPPNFHKGYARNEVVLYSNKL